MTYLYQNPNLPRIGLCATIAEEVAELSVGHVVATVTHARTHGAHANAVHHLTRVAMVPMLIHELALCHRERAQLILEHCVFVLDKNMSFVTLLS